MVSSNRTFYDRIEEYVIAVCFSLMVIITAFTVFSRYSLSFTFSWAEQLTRIFFVWITFAGISLAAGRSMHLRVMAITLIIPKKMIPIVLLFADTLTAIFGFFISYKIFILIQIMVDRNQTFSAIPWLPVWVMYLPGTLGMLGFSIRLIQSSIWPAVKVLIFNNNSSLISK